MLSSTKSLVSKVYHLVTRGLRSDITIDEINSLVAPERQGYVYHCVLSQTAHQSTERLFIYHSCESDNIATCYCQRWHWLDRIRRFRLILDKQQTQQSPYSILKYRLLVKLNGQRITNIFFFVNLFTA